MVGEIDCLFLWVWFWLNSSCNCCLYEFVLRIICFSLSSICNSTLFLIVSVHLVRGCCLVFWLFAGWLRLIDLSNWFWMIWLGVRSCLYIFIWYCRIYSIVYILFNGLLFVDVSLGEKFLSFGFFRLFCFGPMPNLS